MVSIDVAAPTVDAGTAPAKSVESAPTAAPAPVAPVAVAPAAVPVETTPAAQAPGAKMPEPKKLEKLAAKPADAKKTETAITKSAEKPASTTAAVSASAPPDVTSRPPATLGRSVAVEDGDTVWDIAIRYYGGAGPATLKRILATNPTIRDPLKLEVGSTVFLPFSRPDQMIGREGSGYRVLLAAAPTRQGLAGLENWARSIGHEIRVGKASVGEGRTMYELYVAGLPDESAALDLATSLLERITALVKPPQRTAMR